MNIELNRLESFTNWPGNAPVEATRIAKGGFYATGDGNEVQCHWCKKKISDWRYGDQVNSFYSCLGENYELFNAFR